MAVHAMVINKDNTYDAIIIGAGTAAITAAIYLKKGNYNVAYIEKNVPGGRLVNIPIIENYPGFIQVEGADLALKMYEQADALGVKALYGEVSGIDKYNDYQVIYTVDSKIYYTKILIIATGTSDKTLNIENIEKYQGRGISYCAICDGSLTKGKDVVVIGGGDSAVSNAIYLSKICKKVYLVHRRDQFSAKNELLLIAKQKENIEIILSAELKEVVGNEKILTSIKLNNGQTIQTEHLFLYIGSIPSTSFLKNTKLLNEREQIIVNKDMETSIPGIYAVGDVIENKYYQISIVNAQGTIAALNAMEFLSKK